jgi:hypothetical protein
MRALLDEYLKRERLDKDRVQAAIDKAKPNVRGLSAKMDSWVDVNGKQIHPSTKGEYPEGSMPYAVYAMRNVDVQKAYNGKQPPVPGLDKL